MTVHSLIPIFSWNKIVTDMAEFVLDNYCIRKCSLVTLCQPKANNNSELLMGDICSEVS